MGQDFEERKRQENNRANTPKCESYGKVKEFYEGLRRWLK